MPITAKLPAWHWPQSSLWKSAGISHSAELMPRSCSFSDRVGVLWHILFNTMSGCLIALFWLRVSQQYKFIAVALPDKKCKFAQGREQQHLSPGGCDHSAWSTSADFLHALNMQNHCLIQWKDLCFSFGITVDNVYCDYAEWNCPLVVHTNVAPNK